MPGSFSYAYGADPRALVEGYQPTSKEWAQAFRFYEGGAERFDTSARDLHRDLEAALKQYTFSAMRGHPGQMVQLHHSFSARWSVCGGHRCCQKQRGEPRVVVLAERSRVRLGGSLGVCLLEPL